MIKNKRLIITGIFVMALGIYVQILLQDAGAYRDISPVIFGSCQKKGDLRGGEDMVTVKSGAIIISADPRDGGEGALYSYDPAKQEILKLTPEPTLKTAFRPHGIDVHETLHQSLLYVVNHRTEEETVVEVFDFKAGKLFHVKTLKDPFFQSGNDIAAVGEDQFYLSSDFGTPHKAVQKVTQYLRHATGYVSYYDGKKADIVIPQVFYANGLTMDSERKTLFVASMLSKKVGVYDVTAGSPVKIKSLDVDGGPDNIHWVDGNLYVAAHVKLLNLKKESEDRAHKAPSQIIEYSNVLDENPESRVIYANQGEEISSASFALPLGASRLLIGTVFDDHILDCRR